MKITIDLKTVTYYLIGAVILSVGIGAGMLLSPVTASSVDATVGYVDTQQALINHPSYETVKAQVARFKEEKSAELSGYSDMGTLTDTQRQALMDDLKRIEEEIDAEAQRLFEPIIQDVINATTTIGNESGIEVILEQDIVVYGGLNLTPLVIAELRS